MPDSVAPSAVASRRPSIHKSAHPSRRPSMTGASASPTHASSQATPTLSRKSSSGASASPAATSASVAAPPRSRSHSLAASQHAPSSHAAASPAHLPPYAHFIHTYAPHPPPQPSPASPFHASPLYGLTPHETGLLFAHYAAAVGGGGGGGGVHSLGRDEFAGLVADWLGQLRRRGVESAAGGWGAGAGGVALDGVNAAIDAMIAGGAELAGQLFQVLDTSGNERIEREEFKLFLASVDTLVGARIRAEWKKAVIVPRLKALAAL